MRALLAVTVLLLSLALAHAGKSPKFAVFDFEMIDTSLQGEVSSKRTELRRAKCAIKCAIASDQAFSRSACQRR
jgi:hypothetical protein